MNSYPRLNRKSSLWFSWWPVVSNGFIFFFLSEYPIIVDIVNDFIRNEDLRVFLIKLIKVLFLIEYWQYWWILVSLWLSLSILFLLILTFIFISLIFLPSLISLNFVTIGILEFLLAINQKLCSIFVTLLLLLNTESSLLLGFFSMSFSTDDVFLS